MEIATEALRRLDEAEPPVPYPYYICTPDMLMKCPELVFYYRNVALLSQKVMRGVGLETQSFEELGVTPSEPIARELTRYFNRITSELLLHGDITPHRHVVMLAANMGDSLGGTSRNEVGRVAMMRLIHPLLRHLHRQQRLASVTYSLKGAIVADEDETQATTMDRAQLAIADATDIDELLSGFEESRVLYHELQATNGSRLIVNSQLNWHTGTGETHRISPDLYSHVGTTDLFWAGALKGGADPAGSDEHWKTATETLDRILRATEATGRPRPKLSFIATVLVDRVAQGAQSWIEQGKLSSVYNLTQMYENPAEMSRFLNDMTEFLGYGPQAISE
ncbi:MAG: hypothetical protein FJ026_13395 [Chloroflexi bacterium]|nr:hypothetical protein [Chloroflexota bacterium]